MHKKGIYEIAENIPIADKTYKMRLLGYTGDIKVPGQFINIELPGYYLRRPISICDWDEKGMDIIYKVVGDGTKLMSELDPGAKLDILTGLGNGFDTEALRSGGTAAVIGGGVGAGIYFNSQGNKDAAREKLEKALKGRFSPLNYATREMVQASLDSL